MTLYVSVSRKESAVLPATTGKWPLTCHYDLLTHCPLSIQERSHVTYPMAHVEFKKCDVAVSNVMSFEGVAVAEVVRASVLVVWIVSAWVRTL